MFLRLPPYALYKGMTGWYYQPMQYDQINHHLNDPLHMGGSLLETVPDALSMEDPQSKTCCGALMCFGCVYCMDFFCTLPTMMAVEGDDTRAYDLRRLPFYEACWPCMRGALCCGLRDEDQLRVISSAYACPWPSCQGGICGYIFKWL